MINSVIPVSILKMSISSNRVPRKKEIIEAIKHLRKTFGFFKSSDNENDTIPTKKEYPKMQYFNISTPVILIIDQLMLNSIIIDIQ